MTAVVTFCLGVLAVAAALTLVRLARAETIPDRIVALDLLLVFLVNAIGLISMSGRSAAYLDALVVTALLGFVGTVTVARYVEARGGR